MCRHNCCAKSSQEEEVISPPDENLLIYCKPVRLYNILRIRSLFNPSFLPRCLSYKIRAKGKRKSGSAGIVVFNYKDCNNTLQKTEVTENCSCPFCYMTCGSFKGLQLHLNSFHDLFEFEFMLSEDDYQTVNVSVRLDAFESEEEVNHQEKYELISFCSKPRKRRQRGGRNNARRLNVTFLPMDSPSLANGTDNGTSLLSNGNHGLGYPVATQFGMNNSSPAIAQCSLDSNAKAVLASEAVVSAAKSRKLSAERSEARSNLLLQKRQFYHSHRVQPMSLEQVMSDRDSEDEVDDDVADLEDRQLQMLDDFVDVNKNEKRFMHLWNSFVRKQRVVADGHIPWACEAFSKFHKEELLHSSPLFWCWRLFMIKLWNIGLVDSATINNCNIILENCDSNSDNKNKNKNKSADVGIDINSNAMDVDDDVNNSKAK
ncbi:PREDICTED: polycomb group protein VERNALIZATION 2-like isoform X1 [Brassica oleracea var. oleracea]|uniref:polycomb group protein VERNALIZATION 2-like isoform X1 n=1 Tax=Brassica oleracea var. oleracea TaxID=109376 RepID=UPI0006A7052D|nr:PREDICTED: polycomb group protein VERNALIZATION 2-like isoform X1 [Brassica oleracea var. oleracea]XP_013600178.1 PREDICTED: polycomb group protein VERNALIZATION 2-like isoform X1 [Brassica oleracea var. oleracea]